MLLFKVFWDIFILWVNFYWEKYNKIKFSFIICFFFVKLFFDNVVYRVRVLFYFFKEYWNVYVFLVKYLKIERFLIGERILIIIL